ncbi:MAG: transposase [Ruminococcus sp.]
MTVALLKYYERNQQKSQTKFMKTGYSIRTWRMRLVCPEPIWLDRTEEYFQNVVEFYYHLLRQHEELWNSSLFDIQRSLELPTPTGRDGRQPTNPLPMGKVPVYLRRAAINKASATVKSTQELQSGFPEKLEAKVTFFKGMYSDLTDRSICLKLWNGEKWIWTDCNLKGTPPSPRWSANVAHPGKGGQALPAEYPSETGEQSDARTAKERMAEGTNLCSVRFTNTDTFAVCCILDEQGKQLAVHNCRGGDAYRHRCKLLETRIQKSRPNTVGDNSPQPNRKYYMHLKNLSEHYAHQVSREILNFCKENQAGIIVLPDYDQNFTRMAMVKSGNFSPLHLSSKIRTNLQYKAWAEGILVLETRTDGLKDKCAICGGKVRRKEMNSSVKMVIGKPLPRMTPEILAGNARTVFFAEVEQK